MYKIKMFMLICLLLSAGWSFEELQDSVSIVNLSAKADSLAREVAALKADTASAEPGLASGLRWGSGWFASTHLFKDATIGYTFVTDKNRRLSLSAGGCMTQYMKPDSRYYEYLQYPAALLRIGYGTPIYRNFVSIDWNFDGKVPFETAKVVRALDAGVGFGMDIALWLSPQTSILLGGESGLTIWSSSAEINPNGWSNGQVRIGLRHCFSKPAPRDSGRN